MNELQTIARKIQIKRQAISLNRADIEKLQHEAGLLKLRQFFERQIEHTEDQQTLSRYLDMVEFLILALRRQNNEHP